ncbi:hypothetical protein L7F22_034499 [Adiantum nelumboides]|nr:hypothetical protein [Adiantum nelumboides]
MAEAEVPMVMDAEGGGDGVLVSKGGAGICKSPAWWRGGTRSQEVDTEYPFVTAEHANALDSDSRHLRFHGSLARSTENIVQLSDREFEDLSRDLINRRYYTGATTFQLYVVRSELVHGVTLLVPIDASLTQVSEIRHPHRGLVKFHMLEINLNF